MKGNVEIYLDARGVGRILVDGVDLASVCQSVRVEASVYNASPRVTLELAPLSVAARYEGAEILAKVAELLGLTAEEAPSRVTGGPVLRAAHDLRRQPVVNKAAP